jgi:tRNA nucleotidyltransferase (CCA-adding enzyme)
MTPAPTSLDSDALAARLDELPGMAALRAAAEGAGIYLVGGAVRDLLHAGAPDLDVAVEGDPAPVAGRLGGETRIHERFGTASVVLGGHRIDLARTRTESYPRPGSLPVVSWAGIGEDLARRDFSVNAMAIPLGGEPELIDPHAGAADLGAGLIRVLHDRSFADDPTRALRAARYAGRLDLTLEESTHALLAASDLATVSEERVEAELHRLAAESQAVRALALLVEWGLAEADLELGARAHAFATGPPYAGWVDAAAVLLAASAVRVGAYAAESELAAARELASTPDGPASSLAARARGRSGTELVIARALGAGWVDEYVSKWRNVRLAIRGADLLEAGVEQGPAVGRGLAAALRAKLDGEVSGRDEELAAALRAAAS